MLARLNWLPACALALSACAFDATAPGGAAAGSGDGSGDTTDPGDGSGADQPVTGTSPASAVDVVNLASIDEVIGADDLALGSTSGGPEVTIDTGALTITGGALPAADLFRKVLRDGTGGELALLQVRDLMLEGPIHVTGTRPLVIVAHSVQTSATIDVTAHGSTGSDRNVLTSNRGGAIEIYGKELIANSGAIVAGGAQPGAIILQGDTIDNSGGTLTTEANGGGFGPGGGRSGRIYLLYKVSVMTGDVSPMPTQQKY